MRRLGRVLGIDYGTKRVGIALSDESGTLAFPKAILPNDKKILEELKKLIEKEEVQEIVIGESTNFSGEKNPVAKEVEKFVIKLTEKFFLPIEMQKEFLTTVEARRYKPEGTNSVDSSAAALILQRYLDRRSRQK